MAKKSHTSPRAPSASLLKRLDEEHFQRAKDAWHTISDGKPTDDSQVVSSEAVRSALIRPKLILSSFNISEIYSNYIFSNRLFVLTCPKCIKDSERPAAIEVLKRGDLVPVLVGDYADYAPEVIGAILQMPHMSRHELQVYRTMRVVSAAENQVCAHCVKERHDQINKKLAAFDKGGILHRTVQMTLNDLHPFVNPDFELIDALHDAVDAKDAEAIFSLAGASGAINGLRTSQAFDSRWILEAKEMPTLIKGAKKFVKEGKGDSVSMTTSLIEPLSVIVSPKMEPSEYFDLAHQYRGELSSLVDHILTESSGNLEQCATRMSAILGDLNSEVARLQQSKRYLAYRAGFGFLKTNRTLIGTALVAGTLGLAGSLIGCGATVVGGIAGKLLKKAGRLQTSRETTAFLEGVKKSIRPKLHKLLSNYTGISLPAVQLHEIRREIAAKTNAKPVSRLVKASKA